MDDITITAPRTASVNATIPRLSGADARAYLRKPVLPPYPVVLADVMDDAPAMYKWTPAFFRSRYPKLRKEINGRTSTLRDQLDHIMHSTPEDPAPYPFNISMELELPELLADLRPFIKFGSTDRTMHSLMPRWLMRSTTVHELFFGGRGASYPYLHFDLLGMHTQMTQLFGEKEFIFYDPGQRHLLYPSEENHRLSLIPDIFSPDLERFPLFAEARPMSVVLHEGETIFFPGGWWHTTRMHGPSISYGHAIVNASNWDAMVQENYDRWLITRPALARPARAFSRILGAMFTALERSNEPHHRGARPKTDNVFA